MMLVLKKAKMYKHRIIFPAENQGSIREIDLYSCEYTERK